ncbi:MAG: M24 family metallopeptidase [Kiloniellales bacterium]|nr:M24 family metallopeptidase [Kiloniellales bacterium]
MPDTAQTDTTADFQRLPLPKRLCNLERLLHGLEARGLDGVVATQPLNVFYLSSFNGVAHKSDEPRPYAVILSRHAPEHPILVIAEYYLASFLDQPSWIEDIRPFRGVMLSIDVPPAAEDISRFLPARAQGIGWAEAARDRYAFDMNDAVRGALGELGLERGRVAFNDMGFGVRLGLDGLEVADGYDALMYARAVKTAAEMPLVERATRLNEAAIRRTMASWEDGMTWRQLDRAYRRAAGDLGGFVRDPGGMVWGHPRGAEATLMLEPGLADRPLERGAHVMFDCHGTLDLYCWDGGKTWVVEGAPEGPARDHARATAAVAEEVIAAMKPGARISQLQSLGREAYRKAGAPDPAAALVFFHGLGLSHYDVELTTAEGRSNTDWVLEADMVVPLHLLYPGGERERWWLEEVVQVTPQGGRPLFSWGFDPLEGP